MGIDAEIVVRNVRREIVTDEWLKEVSWRMCEAIGNEKFYVKAHDDWTIRPRLAIDRTHDYEDPPRWEPGSEYHEDSYTPVMADPGECLLVLSMMGRYYGPGYERGDLLAYCSIAEWLELNIPGCEVWYGGDSSGVLIERFDEGKRREMKQHLFSPKGREYFRYVGMSKDAIPSPAPCSLCPGGKYHGKRCGWGQTFAAWYCPGCGKSVETQDSGETYAERKKDAA